MYYQLIPMSCCRPCLLKSHKSGIGKGIKSHLIYTVNVIIPGPFTAAILFSFLTYFVFASSTLIPRSIDFGSGGHDGGGNDQMDLRSALIDKPRAIFGCTLLSVAPSILLAMSATGLHIGVYAIAVPEPTITLVREAIHDYMLHSRRRDQGAKARATTSSAATALTRTWTGKRTVSDGFVPTHPSKEDVQTPIDTFRSCNPDETPGSSTRIDHNHDVLRNTTACHRILSLGPAPLPSYPPTIELHSFSSGYASSQMCSQL
ncbi:hypothetical protein BS47DRAFT_260000 [Hydnum rufescens UP504]|uniref:Uncharacterized protein n=1 Tax=Hydnum rufescens UP504 TaxID=1448309 RepID=A0A9P6B6N6_9AGAM|nr:hypothetical protein BS47DRAFT_260000 [Hydnum rufescens UP504]